MARPARASVLGECEEMRAVVVADSAASSAARRESWDVAKREGSRGGIFGGDGSVVVGWIAVGDGWKWRWMGESGAVGGLMDDDVLVGGDLGWSGVPFDCRVRVGLLGRVDSSCGYTDGKVK